MAVYTEGCYRTEKSEESTPQYCISIVFLILLWHFKQVIGLRPDFNNVPMKCYQRFAPLVHRISVLNAPEVQNVGRK